MQALFAKDAVGLKGSIGTSGQHLDATMNWLCRAQDHHGAGGVSAGFSILDGWQAPYPEVTGYIIPTFFDYAAMTGREEIRLRALHMADWELKVQLPTGAVKAGFIDCGNSAEPAVFNTGQVILGYCRTFAETKQQRYLDAAIRAGDWLLQVQAPDGSWVLKSPIVGTDVHTYDVRTAWSLLELYVHTAEGRFADAARLKLDWALTQQNELGWFQNNAFSPTILPFTHNISYVMEGFLGSWQVLGDKRYFDAAQKTAHRLMRIFEFRRFMAGEFDSNWKTTAKYSCLTGDCQIAGVWLRLFRHTGDIRYLNAALKLNDFVKGTQNLHSLHPGIRGGVKGSQPFGGRYTPYTLISWAAKFFADALMLEEHTMADLQQTEN
jgi:uncharacterized protein YyaL (SSP411 family)